jgi:hypothetical protein
VGCVCRGRFEGVGVLGSFRRSQLQGFRRHAVTEKVDCGGVQVPIRDPRPQQNPGLALGERI